KKITPKNIAVESLFLAGGTLSATDKDVILYCKTLLEFRSIFIHGITFVFSYSAPEEDIKIGCALFYWSTNKRKKLPKIIEFFTGPFPEPYWAVRRLIEGIKTNSFKDVLKQFNRYSREASESFLYALKTG